MMMEETVALLWQNIKIQSLNHMFTYSIAMERMSSKQVNKYEKKEIILAHRQKEDP